MLLEAGVVKFFNNSPDQMFGFLISGQGDVHFHMEGYSEVDIDEEGVLKFGGPPLAHPFPWSASDAPDRLPARYDDIMFIPWETLRGQTTLGWCYGDDYKRALARWTMALLADGDPPTTMFEGVGLDLMLAKYGAFRDRGWDDWTFRKESFAHVLKQDPARGVEVLLGCPNTEYDEVDIAVCDQIVNIFQIEAGMGRREALIVLMQMTNEDPVIKRRERQATITD